MSFIGNVGNLANKFNEWSKITSDPWILETIQGYRLEFESTPWQNGPPKTPNYSESDFVLINAEVGKLLSKGAIEQVSHGPGEFVSTLFLVPKKSGDFRPVINLKPFNKFVQRVHFKMESIDLLSSLLQPGDYLASVDLKDAYFSVNMDPRDRKYLRFCWNSIVYEFTCLPFGYSLAPRVFTKILKPVYASLRFQDIRIIYYIDDTLIISNSSDQCSQHAREVCELLTRVGFTVNNIKSQLVPSQQIQFLGFVVDSVSMTLSLPAEKVETIINSCQGLLKNRCPSIRDIAHVTGLLVSAFRAVKYLRLFYRSIEFCKSNLISMGASYEDQASLSATACADLSWVIHNIKHLNGLPIVPPAVDLYIESDASLSGWGACCNSSETGGLWSRVEASYHINYLETLAAFFSLKCFASNARGKHVQLKLDNTTAVFYINNMGGIRSPSLNRLAREIWTWCISKDIWVSAVHVPGVDNDIADFRSRHFSINTEWSLHPSVFEWLCQRTFEPDIDLFASRLNAKVTRFVSWSPDPFAFACDAFSLDWSNFEPYAFPPFSLIPRVLTYLRLHSVQKFLLVTPVWPSQAWYPAVLRMLIDRPILLPRWPNLLQLPHSCQLHPLRDQIQLAAWTLSGTDCAPREFVEGQPRSSVNLGPRERGNSTSLRGPNGRAGVVNGRLILFKHL